MHGGKVNIPKVIRKLELLAIQGAVLYMQDLNEMFPPLTNQ